MDIFCGLRSGLGNLFSKITGYNSVVLLIQAIAPCLKLKQAFVFCQSSQHPTTIRRKKVIAVSCLKDQLSKTRSVSANNIIMSNFNVPFKTSFCQKKTRIPGMVLSRVFLFCFEFLTELDFRRQYFSLIEIISFSSKGIINNTPNDLVLEGY